MHERIGSDSVIVHIDLGENQSLNVPVNRKVLALNMKDLGFAPGQSDWEEEAGIEHIQGDLLAVWATVMETFPNISDVFKYLSPQS